MFPEYIATEGQVAVLLKYALYQAEIKPKLFCPYFHFLLSCTISNDFWKELCRGMNKFNLIMLWAVDKIPV